MPGPLVVPLVILALGAAGLGWAALAKRPGASGGAASQDLAQKVANQGPNGEWVFKGPLADSIVKSLSGQRYEFIDPNARDVVKIAPDARGAPIATADTAMEWARLMNPQLSILAPLTLATSSPADRFLRAVPAGQEQNFTGPETGYAVLLYAGTIDARIAPPGRPPGGGAIVPIGPTPPGGPRVLPTPVSPPGVLPPLPPPGPVPGGFPVPGGLGGLPGLIPAGFNPLAGQEEIKRQLADLCLNGVNADALEAVANTAELFGFVAEAQCLRAKAAQLRAQRPVPQILPPIAPVGPFVPPVAPVGPFVPPPAPPPVIPPPTLQTQFSIVTTRDAPPAGDLIIRATPSMSGPRLPLAGMNTAFQTGTGEPNQIGGAHKNGTVEVVRRVNAEGIDWAEVIWKGDGRTSPTNWRAARGFAKAQFLTPAAQAPVAPPPAVIPGLALPAIPGFPTLPGLQPAGDLITALVPKMRVTTSDPAPSGDLFIVQSPGQAGTPGVGAEKNGLVDVLNPIPVSGPDGNLWLNVRWNGGTRLRPVTGWAKARFLVAVSPTTISGGGSHTLDGEGRAATVASSSGMRLRNRPGAHGDTISLIPAGERVRLLKLAPGQKADTRSPGPGGWAMVEYEGRPGWVQAEWLILG
jgi:hypothetical protein